MSSALGEPELGAPGSRVGTPTSVFLQPIAAPTVLGDFAAASGFLLFGLWLGGSLGGAKSAIAMFPFLLLFAGIGQLAAGLWSVRGRDAIGASQYSVWGGFWIGYGLMWLAAALGTFTLPPFASGFGPLGQVLIYMSAITTIIALAALARSPLRFFSHALAGSAAAVAAAGLISASPSTENVAGWIFVAAAAVFYYHGAASMLNALFGRVVLPYFSWRGEENVPGSQPLHPIEDEHGEPGVKVGN